MTEAELSQVERAVQRIANQLTEEHLALTSHLLKEIATRIDELPADPALTDLLEGSIASNLEMLAHLLRGHVPLSEVSAPAAATEYARRLAQRGTTPSALLRAYRLGQQLIVRWASDELGSGPEPAPIALRASQLITDHTFQYVDVVSEGVVLAYHAERDRWLASRNVLRREAVEAVLRGDKIDLGTTESEIAYRLRQYHLGLVLWTDLGAGDLVGLERVTRSISDALGGGAPLFIARDAETAWAWIPMGRESHVDSAPIDATILEADLPVHVASGTIAAGEPGFRDTHREAVAAYGVAQLGHLSVGRQISFTDPNVRVASHLAQDLDATRRLVHEALGDLSDDSEGAERLRDTLLVFIQERESYVGTATRLHMHRNTVKYRIDKAVEALGAPVNESRLELELALIASAWLAPEVIGARNQIVGGA